MRPIFRASPLPPSRHALHRRLRLPDLRTGDDSPQDLIAPGRVKTPAIPDSYRLGGVSDPTPTSRSQLERYIINAIAKMLPRCPYCARRYKRNTRRIL